MESSKNKPTWLQILEAESWQAELLISGVAIFGSLQLPGLLIDLYDWILLNFSEGYLRPLFYAVWYLMIVSAMLIVNFILHFVLRALWIGMLGLVSVYPDGINRESDMYSQHYLDQLINDFPDVNEFIQRLDRIASQIFSFSFSAAFGMLSFSILLSFILIITFFLKLLIPSLSEELIFFILFVGLLIPSVLSGVMNTKKLRDKEWVKKIHYFIGVKVVGRMIFTIFYEPINYTTYIFFTNNKKNRAVTTLVLYLVIVMCVAMPTMMRSNVGYHQQESFFRMDRRMDLSIYYNYEDQLDVNRFIIHPVITSEKIYGPLLHVFIPVAQREEASLKKLCGEFKTSEQLSDDEEKQAKRKFRLECLRRYYHFYLNDQLLDSADLLQHIHANRSEEGVLCYLPTAGCKTGLNYLKIKFEYFNADGDQKEANIPFWYSGE